MKKKPTTDDLLNAMVANAPAKCGQKCRCCGHEVVRALLVRYYQRKDAGEDMPSIGHIARMIERDYHISPGSVRGHIRRCLKR